jgi:hypothetical protein
MDGERKRPLSEPQCTPAVALHNGDYRALHLCVPSLSQTQVAHHSAGQLPATPQVLRR